MKISRIAAAGCILLLAASCARTAGIKGTVTGASNDEVIVKLLEVNSYNVAHQKETIATVNDMSEKLKATAENLEDAVHQFKN